MAIDTDPTISPTTQTSSDSSSSAPTPPADSSTPAPTETPTPSTPATPPTTPSNPITPPTPVTPPTSSAEPPTPTSPTPPPPAAEPTPTPAPEPPPVGNSSQNTPPSLTNDPAVAAALGEQQPGKKVQMGNVVKLTGIGVLLVGAASALIIFSQTGKSEPVTNTETQAVTPKVAQELALNIDSPTDGTVLASNVATIKGKTLPNITVAYYSDTDDGTVDSDASGNFEGTLKLANGINTVTITAFGNGGEEKSTTMTIVYNSEN